MLEIRTIGHSTRPIEELIALLDAHGIEAIADVRRYPYSRRHPQFNQDRLAASLEATGREYRHLPEIGGRRDPLPDSVNTAWRSAAFRGFADHMGTPEFARGLEALLELAARRRTVILCAEAVPWKCHRLLISDALTARGIPVSHVTSAAEVTPHALSATAQVEGSRVTYPGTRTERLL